MWLVIERMAVKLHKPYYKTAKRAMDIVLCLLAAPLFIPLVAVIAILIRLESVGPIFVMQERIGKGHKLFKIIKFRTMYHHIGPDSGRTYTKAFINGQMYTPGGVTAFKPFNESQITKVGRILRKTALDELPQLMNVLKGEMSFVGPRPTVQWEVEAYQDWQPERFEVLPGITGLAQVRGRNGISFDEIVRYDIQYLEQHSLWLDLKILWWTVISVFE